MNSSLDKDKIIETQGELIKKLQKQVKEWEDWKASSKERHAKGKAKANIAISKNKSTLRRLHGNLRTDTIIHLKKVVSGCSAAW